MVSYEEGEPYQKYRKKKNTLGNIVGGFMAVLIGTSLVKRYDRTLKLIWIKQKRIR